MSNKLNGLVAIVTGGSKGYGAGIAEVLKKNGAEVWITGRDRVALEGTVQRLGVHGIVADITSPSDWDRVFEEVLAYGGHVDILVNNAGGGIRIAAMESQTDESIEQIIATNLTGHLFGCRRAAKIMHKQQSGLIVNISSGCAIHAWPGWGPYSAAKAGLSQFGHCLYTELRESGVRVTTIMPYWGATEFVQSAGIVNHPAADPEIRKEVIQPWELGQIVLDICLMPPHLVMPDITVQPLVQRIEPM